MGNMGSKQDERKAYPGGPEWEEQPPWLQPKPPQDEPGDTNPRTASAKSKTVKNLLKRK